MAYYGKQSINMGLQNKKICKQEIWFASLVYNPENPVKWKVSFKDSQMEHSPATQPCPHPTVNAPIRSATIRVV